MDEINIELKAKGENLFSSFELFMWIPKNENDINHSAEKSFLHGKITLMNGEIISSGIFQNLPLRVSKNRDGVYSVVVSDYKAIGVLPDGVTNENSVIEVVTISDGGIDEKLAIETAINNNSLAINIFPNPTSERINISVKNGNTQETYSVTLYDLNGKMITTIENNISAENLSNRQINLSEVIEEAGVYYILIKSITGEQSNLQKIIYQ